MNPATLPTQTKTPMATPAVQERALRQLEALDPPAELIEPELSENARKVLERRYLKKDPDTGAVSESPRQLLWRVAAHIA